jgi:hypothetical protein
VANGWKVHKETRQKTMPCALAGRVRFFDNNKLFFEQATLLSYLLQRWKKSISLFV